MKIKDLSPEAQHSLDKTITLRLNEDLLKLIETEVNELRDDGFSTTGGRAAVIRQLIWSAKTK